MLHSQIGFPAKLCIATIATATVAVVLPSTALAGVGVSSSLTVPVNVSVGDTGVNGSFTVININTPPNNTETNTITTLQVAPACGAAPAGANTCPTPDAGVFGIASPAIGAAATKCAGTSFTVSAPNASGIVTFTPASTVVLDPPGGAVGSDRCTVNFTLAVLKQPTIDVSPPTPGVQTAFNARAVVQASSGSTVATNPSLQVTVSPGIDSDGDGVVDGFDNCPAAQNSSQSDVDGDKLGDACDPQDDRPVNADTCTVPSVKKGSRTGRAKGALLEAGCTVEKVKRVRSKKVRRGRVIRVKPGPGTELPAGEGVVIVKSTGPRKR